MLFLLVAGLFVSSGLVLMIKRSKESVCLFGLCVSLLLQCTGTLIFIAKKGGISFQLMNFLFFSLKFRDWAQHLYIPLSLLGYLIAVGRYLFPLFFVMMAWDYSMIPWIRSHYRMKYALILLPALSLVVYYPKLFFFIIDHVNGAQDFIVQVSYFWCILYIAIGFALMLTELLSITMKLCRRQFAGTLVLMTGLSGLYLLYCGQDPAQVYRFYSYAYFWRKGIGYLQYVTTVPGYLVIVVVNIAGAVVGMGGILKYTTRMMTDRREEAGLRKKYDTAKSNASMFVHGIKNQLLANRVLHKRLEKELEKENPDFSHVKQYVDDLNRNNEYLVNRTEALYKSVKSNRTILKTEDIRSIAEEAVRRTGNKYPEAEIQMDIPEEHRLLADRESFSEMIYNLMTNAWEANVMADHKNFPVECICQEERLYNVLMIRDHGVGIDRKNLKRIFDPFYSSKNTNENWGMGLTYVQKVIRAHYCRLEVESEVGKGTCFYIMIPRYDGAAGKKERKEH